MTQSVIESALALKRTLEDLELYAKRGLDPLHKNIATTFASCDTDITITDGFDSAIKQCRRYAYRIKFLKHLQTRAHLDRPNDESLARSYVSIILKNVASTIGGSMRFENDEERNSVFEICQSIIRNSADVLFDADRETENAV